MPQGIIIASIRKKIIGKKRNYTWKLKIRGLEDEECNKKEQKRMDLNDNQKVER